MKFPQGSRGFAVRKRSCQGTDTRHSRRLGEPSTILPGTSPEASTAPVRARDGADAVSQVGGGAVNRATAAPRCGGDDELVVRVAAPVGHRAHVAEPAAV